VNIFVAMVFPLAALLLPFKALFSKLAHWLLSLQDWRALAMCEGIYLLLTDSNVYKGHLQSVMKHYYRIAIPMALLCLGLSIFILGRAHIGPVVDISSCESGEQLSFSRAVSNPEDLAVASDNQFIVFSEFGRFKPRGLIKSIKKGDSEESPFFVKQIAASNCVASLLLWHYLTLTISRIGRC
jgi:hypothetical protein